MVSPTEYWFSMRMKMPVSMSLKMDWAPKEMPRPMTPAEAMKGPSETPRAARIWVRT